MVESEPKILRVETDKNETEKKKNRFFSDLRKRLLALAAAGFITLGGGWEKGLAEQLKVVKVKDEAPQFLLEKVITPEKLKTFEEKLKKEEPEFIEWLSKYSKTVSDRLGSFTEGVLNFQEDQDVDQFFMTDDGALPQSIYTDHQTLANIKKEPGKFRSYQEFLKDNLYTIILSTVFLDNSRAVRNNMLKLVEPPSFLFVPHGDQYASTSPLPRDQYGHYIKDPKATKWKPEIIFTLRAYYQEELDFNIYINVFIHELVHALHPGAQNLDNPLKNMSGLTSILEEGLTQNITLEIVQQLSSKNTKLKPAVSIIDYDERVVLAAILEGISRSKKNNDSLSRWHTRIINDSKLVNELIPILEDLGLDRSIAQDLKEVGPAPLFGGSILEVNFEERKSYKMLAGLLARLKADGIELSPDFIESILTKGRLLDNFQVQAVRDKFESLARH